jgi:hypothetical protein
MANYFGVVDLIDIENHWSSENESKDEVDEKDQLTDRAIKIVHYADCQQLTLWLPIPGNLYDQISMTDKNTQVEVWRKDVAEILSGSIQIILDTLDYAPSEYSILISRKDGFRHLLHIKKYEECILSPVKPVKIELSKEKEYVPVVYRDGFGNVIQYEDSDANMEIFRGMNAMHKRKVSYKEYGRSNDVIYTDGEKMAKFYSEIGTGNCIFYIHIPSVENWESETDFSVAERDEILQFIAETVLRDKTTSSGAYFEIEDKWINFYNEQ